MRVNEQDLRRADSLDRSTKVLISVLGAAAFVAVLDGTAVTASLEVLRESFATDIATIVWVTSGYLVAAGAALPLVGWASDRYGGRTVFLVGLGMFVAGSLLTGAAWDVASLVAFRVIQGFGGGLLEPAALAVAAALAPRSQVGRVMGRFSLIINIAPVVGPLLGTLLADNGLWRLTFLINLPLGVLILLAALRWVPAPARAVAEGPPSAPDIRGMVLLSSGFVAVLWVVNRSADGSAAAQVIVGAFGAMVLVGYVVHALTTTRSPVLDLRLLSTPSFAAALVGMAGVGFLMYSQLTIYPLLAESRFQLTGLGRGLLTAALGLGLIVSMSNAGSWSDRIGPRRIVTVGGLITTVGFGVLAITAHLLPLWASMTVTLVVGLGFGSVASPMFASVYRILPQARIAQGTTALFIVVQLFASAGVTVMGLLIGPDGAPPFATVFAILAATALAIAVNALRLPGRPSTE
ncbi:MFS transporter [Nakamurella sp. A5-74]|uniref:MFS transporter n=1 Tax=Nakamurella sp. A5-74 TaxID=3158264 RepID=A0AAU8DN66_9ACTN